MDLKNKCSESEKEEVRPSLVSRKKQTALETDDMSGHESEVDDARQTEQHPSGLSRNSDES